MKSLDLWLEDNNKNISNIDKLDWHDISYQCELSEEFIREFQDKVDWYYISYNQKLSEEFITEFKHKVNWNGVSECQKLSKGFIREFQDKINFKYIIPCFYSDEFQSKIESSWKYKNL